MQQPTTPHQQRDPHLRRCRKAFMAGEYTKATNALCSHTPPVAPSYQARDTLQELHPQPTIPVSPTPRQHLPIPLKIGEDTIRRIIRRMAVTPGPGPDGMRLRFLKYLLAYPGGQPPDRPICQELTKFTNAIIAGKLPQGTQTWFATGTLIGIQKKDPSKLRSLAMGLVWRRFVARVLAVSVSRNPDLLAYLQPHQFAVGMPCGTEAVIHILRATCNKLRQKELVVISIDARNAFNSIERQCILSGVTQHCPGIARFIHYCYGSTIPLRFGEFVINSVTGTQQGDPLSPLLFALALHPLILDIQSRFSPILNLFFADDGTLLVPRLEAKAVMNYIVQKGEKIGFVPNLEKTHAWWWAKPTIPSFQATITSAAAIPVLGSPLGHADASTVMMKERIKKQERLVNALASLSDPHMAYLLLRLCAGTCKMIYTVRTTPPHLTRDIVELFDEAQRSAFQTHA
ncbi:reverse transcriptase [Gracilaria domingensis]|nr:reverse transcriptase [Gracilaria domingensis]